jgi:acetyl-CoA carboxylase biotin carboxyl carrier protein
MRDSMRALLKEDGDERLLVAPAVGRCYALPPKGTYLDPGAPMGVLRVLNHRYLLIVPQGASGIVGELRVSARGARVEYGESLLSLSRRAELEPSTAGTTAEDAPVGEEIGEGMLAVRSPTDGIFYRRPSPDEPSYVSEGDVVEHGRVLGLVEVMKCFNQISWGGEPDAPDRARIVRVLPDDAAEVKLDQVLFVLDPAVD